MAVTLVSITQTAQNLKRPYLYLCKFWHPKLLDLSQEIGIKVTMCETLFFSQIVPDFR